MFVLGLNMRQQLADADTELGPGLLVSGVSRVEARGIENFEGCLLGFLVESPGVKVDLNFYEKMGRHKDHSTDPQFLRLRVS